MVYRRCPGEEYSLMPESVPVSGGPMSEPGGGPMSEPGGPMPEPGGPMSEPGGDLARQLVQGI